MPISAKQISTAFPDVAPFSHRITGCPPEIFDLQRVLEGKSWTDVDAATCDRHPDALVMLDLEPLTYFLPAFLVAAVLRPNSAAAEAVVYFACGPAFDEVIPTLSLAQQKAVLDTAEAVLNADRGFFADQTEAFLRRAARLEADGEPRP